MLLAERRFRGSSNELELLRRRIFSISPRRGEYLYAYRQLHRPDYGVAWQRREKTLSLCHSFPKLLSLMSRPRRGRFWQRKENALRSTVTDEDQRCGKSRRTFPAIGDLSTLFIQNCCIRPLSFSEGRSNAAGC
jgi:hypothetical protein